MKWRPLGDSNPCYRRERAVCILQRSNSLSSTSVKLRFEPLSGPNRCGGQPAGALHHPRERIRKYLIFKHLLFVAAGSGAHYREIETEQATLLLLSRRRKSLALCRFREVADIFGSTENRPHRCTTGVPVDSPCDRGAPVVGAGGAGDFVGPTRDPDLGKVVLYQLSYSRVTTCCPFGRNRTFDA